MEESIFLDHVGDSPWTRLLQHLIGGRDLDFTLTDLLQARVSWGTINNLVPRMLKLSIITSTRKIGRITLYKINKDNETAMHFIELYDTLIFQEFSKFQKKVNKVKVSA